MSITDVTYYAKRPTKLPQSEGLGNGVATQIAEADEDFITDNLPIYEYEFFIRLLGRDLGQEFWDAYIASVVDGAPALATKWQDLLDLLLDTVNKRSPIANYCFFHIIPQTLEQMTRRGGALGKQDELMIMGVSDNQVRAWNLMADTLVSTVEWLEDNKADYEHDDVYLDTDYLLVDIINRYGI